MKKTRGTETETTVVPMLDPEIVARIRLLRQLGWGTKRIAKQERPEARRLDADERGVALKLLDGPAEGNAVVVQRLLARQEIKVWLRTLQTSTAKKRLLSRASRRATQPATAALALRAWHTSKKALMLIVTTSSGVAHGPRQTRTRPERLARARRCGVRSLAPTPPRPPLDRRSRTLAPS
jgi:hypothetical protein